MKDKTSPIPKPRKDDQDRWEDLTPRFDERLSFHTPPIKLSKKNNLESEDTPETEISSPESPMDDDYNSDLLNAFVSADDGYLGDPEEVRERRRLRRSQTTGVSRRSSRAKRPYSSYGDLPSPSSSEPTSSDSSPDRPNVRRKKPRSLSSMHKEEKRKNFRLLQFTKFLMLAIAGMFSIATMYWTYPVSEEEVIIAQYMNRRQYKRGHTDSGLRGKLVRMVGRKKEPIEPRQIESNLFEAKNSIIKHKAVQTKLAKAVGKHDKIKKEHSESRALKFNPPPPIDVSQSFEFQDAAMYDKASSGSSKRIVSFGNGLFAPAHRTVALYPADFTDNTQFYGMYDSDDERLSHMEVRQPLEQGECVPMQEWQTTYHPFCNGVHELGIEYLGHGGDNFSLFGTKGFWRNAWKVDLMGGHSSLKERETLVLKTLK